MSNLTSRFVENGTHYFATSLTNEEILAQTQFSSNAEVQTLARRIAELADALDVERAAREYLETHIFERKWDGTIGRKPHWYMAGPYRHELAKWQGSTLLEAIASVLADPSKP